MAKRRITYSIMTLKEKYYKYSDRPIYSFDNLFNFVDFCFRNKWTPENSVTEFDDERNIIYIKHL